MELLTNLNNKNSDVEISQLSEFLTVENTNTLVVTNTQSTSVNKQYTLELKANSSLDLTIISTSSAELIENQLNFELNEGASLKVVIVSLNTFATTNTITANLNGENSSADINVISVASNTANSKFNVIANNNAAYTNSNITQRAVALNGGQNIFEATGYIGKDCSKAVNFQESRVLLLDGAAKGDASPILLINHHDVEAGHAAGVSRVSNDEMYYLMSRGIDRKSAEQLMTVAFIRPVIDKIIDEQLRETVFEKIKEKASYEKN